ncbi:hypothetical protein KJA13_02805 [Patescibacteria group bacterium]|nr:hypothetical protein [Patescibacteria group bacterium]
MKISAPTNFDFRILEKLKGTVHDTYGSLQNDAGGTVLPSYALPKVDTGRFKEYVEYSHELGIKFNYVLNHPNITITKQRIALLDRLSKINVDMVTASNYSFISFVKKEYPFKICSSIACKIDSLKEAMLFKELDCDVICLDYTKNSDLEFIRLVKQKTALQIKLLANNICLPNCPYWREHLESAGHFQKGIFKCLKLKLNNPSLFRETGFIYPNDVKKYEGIGVDFLKLGGRTKPANWIINCAMAYSQKSYNGNCFRLVNTSVAESRYSSIISILLKFFPTLFIRTGLKCLYFCNRKELYGVLSKERHIKSLLKIYLTKDTFYMDSVEVSVDQTKKECLLKEINKLFETV